MPKSLLHLVYRCQQIGSQVFIEIDSMLFCIGIYNYPIRNRPVVVLFHQIAVCRQLHDVVSMGLLGSSALNFHWNQAATSAFDYVIRLAADAEALGIQGLSWAVQIRVDHLSRRNSINHAYGFCR